MARGTVLRRISAHEFSWQRDVQQQQTGAHSMNFENPDDRVLAALLRSARAFAVVGASARPDRPSYVVMQRLQQRGYRVIPVNPGQAGGTILGEMVYASLREIPEPVDVVDVFRSSDAALAVAHEAIAEKDRLGIKAIWMQIGVVNEEAAEAALAAGLEVVMDRCPKIELDRLDVAR